MFIYYIIVMLIITDVNICHIVREIVAVIYFLFDVKVLHVLWYIYESLS